MLNDVRYALRLLRRTPAFTLAAILTLALGIGAITAIYTLVEAVLLRPLAIDEPQRVVTLQSQLGERTSRTFSYPIFRRYQEQTAQVFESLAGSGLRSFSVSVGNDTRLARAAFVTEDYFTMAGVRVAQGRTFGIDEHRQGAEPVVVLTDAFWRTRMAADPGVIGQQVRVADRHATIVGVAPRGFRGLELASPADMFIPIATAPLVLPPANYFSDATITIGGLGFSPQSWMRVTARLRHGASIPQAEALLSTIAGDTGQSRPPSLLHLVEVSQTALAPRTQGDTTRFTALLGMVVALVLLVGCANLAGLILARNEQRRREASVRLALGARRGSLVRLFMIESLMLSILGGFAGLAVAAWMIQIMNAFVIPGGINIEALQLWLTGRILLFAAGAALFTTLLTGLMPAIAGSRVDVVSGLKAQGVAATSGRSLARSMLVTIQVAISLVLLVTGGLFVRSLQSALATDVGTDAEHLAYATVAFTSAQYDQSAVERFYSAMLDRLRNVPGIDGVTFGGLPLVYSAGSDRTFWIDGVERRFEETLLFHTGPDYFATVGVPLVTGRGFGPADTARSTPVVIVTEAFARAAWPGQDPVGRRLTFLPLTHDLEVVGVARGGRYVTLNDPDTPGIFLLWRQNSRWARSAGPLIVLSDHPASVVGVLQRTIRDYDPKLPITAVATMESRVAVLAMTQRIGASFLSWFSALALALALLGVYGLIAHSVTTRTNEIGVRLALGAESRDVVMLTMRRSFVPVAGGIVLGLAGAYAVTGLATVFLFGIAPYDMLSFTGATLCLLVAASVASYIPARRAARVDPMIALRAE